MSSLNTKISLRHEAPTPVFVTSCRCRPRSRAAAAFLEHVMASSSRLTVAMENVERWKAEEELTDLDLLEEVTCFCYELGSAQLRPAT